MSPMEGQNWGEIIVGECSRDNFIEVEEDLHQLAILWRGEAR